MELIEIYLGKLRSTENNLKKAPNRIYTKIFLEKKLKETHQLRNQIIDELVCLQDVIDEEIRVRINTESKFLLSSIIQAIELKIPLAKSGPNYTFKNLARLAIICRHLTMGDVFDIKTATAIVQPYDGCADKLEAFVDAANLLNELTKEAHRPMAIKFLKTRLNGKARQCLPENIATIDDLVKQVKEQCMEVISPQSIIAKLKVSSQKGDVAKFCSEVESLTTQLQNVYISQKIPGDVAKSMATKAGIDTLINGIKNTEMKIILKAGTFPSVKEAVQKINENLTQETNNPNQILHMSSQRYTNRGRQNFNTQRGNFRGRFTNSNRYSWNRNGNNNRNNGNRQYSNNHENQNRFNPRNHYQNNSNRQAPPRRDYHSHNRNVYCSENENNPSTPPQVDVNRERGEQIVHPRR